MIFVRRSNPQRMMLMNCWALGLNTSFYVTFFCFPNLHYAYLRSFPTLHCRTRENECWIKWLVAEQKARKKKMRTYDWSLLAASAASLSTVAISVAATAAHDWVLSLCHCATPTITVKASITPATHHSYKWSPRLSDFSGSPLEVRLLNRSSRKMAQTTWIHAMLCLSQ